MKVIDPLKGADKLSAELLNSTENLTSNKKKDRMEIEIHSIIEKLSVGTDKFNKDEFYSIVENYLKNYDRILYSTISADIYGKSDPKNKNEVVGMIMTNLEWLVDNPREIKKGDPEEKIVIATNRAITKMLDHVSLASQQYLNLKQTDDEYDKKFKDHISVVKDNITQDIVKEVNSQLITLVGIFTALAFLIFGSISSLDGIFENNDIPLFKTMSIGIIWGICILNMIFVFLFCISKMTKLNFKSDTKSDATIFRRYPVVWWTNLILISLLLLTIWAYFLTTIGVGENFARFCEADWGYTCIFGTIIVILIITAGCKFLMKKTKKGEIE